MTKGLLVRLAEKWEPDSKDPFGQDKKALIQFLLQEGVTSANPRSIDWVIDNAPLSTVYTRNKFQHKLLGPLRRDPKVFVGTSSAGIFLVTSADDADQTIGFYTWRVRAELRHARNLRGIAKRYKLFEGHQSKLAATKERAVIFIDESGTPDVADTNQPLFVVGAVVIQSRQELAGLEQRFRNALSLLGRPPEQELKTSGLSSAKHARVLKELSLVEYQWAAACFVKKDLISKGFENPKTLYRYALQFLIGDLLMMAWQADLIIDESSTTEFQNQVATYLRRENSGLPIQRLRDVKFKPSNKDRLIQLADLVVGAVRRHAQNEKAPLREIEHQVVSLQFWPPR